MAKISLMRLRLCFLIYLVIFLTLGLTHFSLLFLHQILFKYSKILKKNSRIIKKKGGILQSSLSIHGGLVQDPSWIVKFMNICVPQLDSPFPQV